MTKTPQDIYFLRCFLLEGVSQALNTVLCPKPALKDNERNKIKILLRSESIYAIIMASGAAVPFSPFA